jgi:hypothetical protein
MSMVLLVNPAGEFPLNDDWSYARAVQLLVQHGRLELTGFTSMTLIAQVFWGALFCLPFGFSFTALRVSTITLGILGLVVTYRLSKEMKVDSAFALLAVILLAMNPLYFLLSLTFMTDVPFFTFSMLGVLFLLRALRSDSHLDLLAGYTFAVIAILIRQLAIVIPVSFLIAYLAKNGIGLRAFRNALVPSAASGVLLLIFPRVLHRTIGLPVLYNRSFEPITEAASTGLLEIPLVFADRLLVEIIYLGLFMLPLLIALRIDIQQGSAPQSRRVWIFAGSMLFSSILGLFIWQGRLMPLIGGVLFDIGLGPVLLRDTYLLRLPHWPTLPKELWLLVTAVAVLGSVLLVYQLSVAAARTMTSKAEAASIIFVLSAAVLYSVLIAIAGFLDRYLIWLLPLLMGVILAPRNPVRLRARVLPLSIAVALIFIYGLFALGSTHDYLAWNRARWQALGDLMGKNRISYRNIDGGFEFNGWYAYDAKYRERSPKSWWWVDGDDYVISFGPISGYVEMRRYPFQRWIPFGQGNIFVLKRLRESTKNG